MMSGADSVFCFRSDTIVTRVRGIVNDNADLQRLQQALSRSGSDTVALLWQCHPRPDLRLVESIFPDRNVFPMQDTKSDNKTIGDQVFKNNHTLFLTNSATTWKPRPGYDNLVSVFDKILYRSTHYFFLMN